MCLINQNFQFGEVEKLNAKKLIGIMLVIILFVSSCQGRSFEKKNTNKVLKGEKKMIDLHLRSPAFENKGRIPKKYTADGEDISPPLEWDKPPSNTKSLVIICDDPDAPVGVWDHWILFNIPPTTTSLPEGIPQKAELDKGMKHGRNSWGRSAYGGPSPPPGKPHRYFFKIYALDVKLNLPHGTPKKKILQSMEGHILATGELMGTYGR